MKKVFIVSFSLVLIVFVWLTINKGLPDEEDAGHNNDLLMPAEKEKIQAFWKIYRQANKQRIRGELDSAVVGYRLAQQYNDKHEDTLYYLGNVYRDLGHYDEAEKCWQKLLNINPGSARACFQLGHLSLNFVDIEFFDINRAAEYFQQVLVINSEESGSMYYLGQIELIRGNYQEAHKIFDALSGLNYNNLNASFLNSYVDWKLGNPQRAIRQMTRALKIFKSPPPVKGMSNEGDTKTGKPLFNSMNSERSSLFYTHVFDLAKLSLPLDKELFQQRYKKLDVYLGQLRSKI